MQKIVAMLLASLPLVPTGTFAQTITPTGTAPLAAKLESSGKPSTLREAAIREARSAVAAGDGLQQAPPQRSWASRHPVGAGALIGAGVGAGVGAVFTAVAIDVGYEGAIYYPLFMGGFAGLGSAAGALIGHFTSK